MNDDEPPPIFQTPEPDEGAEPVVEATSGRGLKKRENRIKREAREAREFWVGVLKDPIGRRELWRLFCGPNGGHAFETRFAAGPAGFPDSNATWYERGVQDFALRAYRYWITLDPAAVVAMHKENEGG